jgi:hypothetical protein
MPGPPSEAWEPAMTAAPTARVRPLSRASALATVSAGDGGDVAPGLAPPADEGSMVEAAPPKDGADGALGPPPVGDPPLALSAPPPDRPDGRAPAADRAELT